MNKTWTIVIVILILAAGVWWFNGGNSNVSLYPTSSASPSSVATKTPTGYKPTVKPTTPAPTSSLTYSQLVQQYGSNRVQFDNNCQAQPANATFKNGARILLDNRSNQARTISVGTAKYNLVPYGYQVVTLSSTTVPTNLGLSCGNQVNVGIILLQANISGQ